MLQMIQGALTDVTTEAQNSPGATYTELHPTLGPRVWKYVKNGEASTAFAEGTVIRRKSSNAEPGVAVVAPIDSLRDGIMGVAQHAIAAGSYGWVGYTGLFEVLSGDTDIVANTAIIVSAGTAGTADTVGANTPRSFGFATEAALTAALATCWISCQG